MTSVREERVSWDRVLHPPLLAYLVRVLARSIFLDRHRQTVADDDQSLLSLSSRGSRRGHVARCSTETRAEVESAR